MAIHQPADGAVAQSFGGRIHRQHPARFERGFGTSVRENHVFPRGHLLAVIVSDGSRYEQRLSHRDAAVEKRLPRPDALQCAAGITNHRTEDAKPFPGRRHRLGNDDTGTGDLIAHPHAGERGDARGIHIAVRDMAEEIAGGVHPQPGEGISSALAHALEKLDRCVQPERRHGPASIRRCRAAARRSGRRQRARGRRATRRCPRSVWGAPARCGAPPPHRRGRCRRAW